MRLTFPPLDWFPGSAGTENYNRRATGAASGLITLTLKLAGDPECRNVPVPLDGSGRSRGTYASLPAQTMVP